MGILQVYTKTAPSWDELEVKRHSFGWSMSKTQIFMAREPFLMILNALFAASRAHFQCDGGIITFC